MLLPIVVVAVVVLAGVVAVVLAFAARGTYDQIGRSDMTFDHEARTLDERPTRRSPGFRGGPQRPRGSRVGSRRSTSRPRSSGVWSVRTGSLPAMPALRRFDVDELLTRPGTYFNPETEIVLVVDDSAHVDLELIEEEEDGAEWILLGDDPAIDEHKRDELVETFETRRARSAAREDPDEDEVDDEEELEPDPDDDY